MSWPRNGGPVEVRSSLEPIAFVDGAPQVEHLPHDELEIDGEPYMRRFFVWQDRQSSLRFHHILRSDLDQDLHDHPWDFTSTVLSGGYVETTVDGDRRFDAPCVIFRRAEMLHRLTLPDGPVWTMVYTGPVRRRWGFQTADGWVHWSDYLRSAPTDEGQTSRW